MAVLNSPAPGGRAFDWRIFTPKLVTAFQGGYDLDTLRRDAFAGATVAIVALPLAMALAIASGATPEKGLMTAVVAGLLISAFSGSRFQIGGPTGAFVVVVYNVISREGYDGLLLATFMAGVLLLIAGFARLGEWIKYIPEPVVVGFTGGIGIIIASSQVRDLLGLSMHGVPADFIPKWQAMWAARASLSPWAAGVAFGGVGVILALRRWAPRAPGFLIVVVLASALVALGHLPVETLGSRFGHLNFAVPTPRLPPMSWARVRILAPSAFTIALLAGVESLLSAMVADGMTGRRHRSNMELVGQGIANLGSALFGGLPATGAVARTATNIQAGGRTPVAGIIHAALVLAFMLVGARLSAYVPLASLAAILVVVAWNMSEPRKIGRFMRAPGGERLVLVTTLALTVLVDLTVAIGVGVVMAAMIFMHRMAQAASLTEGSVVDEDADAFGDGATDQRDALPPGVQVFQLRGPLFYGAATSFADMLDVIDRPPRAIILRMSRASVMDVTGAGVLRDFVRRWRKEDVRIILSGVRNQPLQTLESLGMGPGAGEVEFAGSYSEALTMARSPRLDRRNG